MSVNLYLYIFFFIFIMIIFFIIYLVSTLSGRSYHCRGSVNSCDTRIHFLNFFLNLFLFVPAYLFPSVYCCVKLV